MKNKLEIGDVIKVKETCHINYKSLNLIKVGMFGKISSCKFNNATFDFSYTAELENGEVFHGIRSRFEFVVEKLNIYNVKIGSKVVPKFCSEMDNSIGDIKNRAELIDYVFSKYPYGESAKVISINQLTNEITVEYKSGNKLTGLVQWFNWAFDDTNFSEV